MIKKVVKTMSMSSALKASLFAIVVVAAFSSFVVISEIDTSEGAEVGTSFSEGGLNYLIETDSTVEVTGLDDLSITDLVIPSSVTYDSVTYDVTSIKEGAFFYTDLSSVTIQENVTSIGDYAFYYCISLTSVTIPGSITFFGESAFEGCTGLTSVTMQE
ncbi:MAG: leucine-rich repeat domain-containing protein, partial [Candidatus Methanomethylophilaceae archaeon]